MDSQQASACQLPRGPQSIPGQSINQGEPGSVKPPFYPLPLRKSHARLCGLRGTLATNDWYKWLHR